MAYITAKQQDPPLMTDEFRALFAKALNLPAESINDDLSPENHPAWDSLATVNLIVGLEERYQIVFDFDELMKMTAVRQIRDLLASKGIAA